MSLSEKGYSLLTPDEHFWRPSNLMKIPNTNLLQAHGSPGALGGRLWRMPPFSANTLHKHVEHYEFYFVLEGVGRMRINDETVSIPKHGSVLVAPSALRQVFNDTSSESLWLIVGAPPDPPCEHEDYYPVDPTRLPPELAGKQWPPES